MKEHHIEIRNGEAQFVYDDTLASLAALGRVERASHVEPHPTEPGWIADMRPSGGPIIGQNVEVMGAIEAFTATEWAEIEPFATRQDALDAEREWLRRERGL